MLHNEKNSNFIRLYYTICSNGFVLFAGTGCYDSVSMPTRVVGALRTFNTVELFSGADTCFATTGTCTCTYTQYAQK